MKCFVIMPFGNPKVDAENAKKLDSIYTQWIKPAVESIAIPESGEKITCHRADKTFRPGEIITHIIENLVSSEIVIADLSGRNPNVFYELGVRHAIRNNCILISDNLDDIPFDLRPLRTIVYQYEPASMLELKNSLEQAVREIIADPNGIDNPVRKYLYNKELSDALKQSSSEATLIKNVVAEMASLRKEFDAQTNEIREIMKLITAKHAPNHRALDIRSMEGIWEDRHIRSTFYVRTIKGEPYIPYSYAGVRSLTGHVYNCKIIDNTIFGRFEWFSFAISGYIYLKIENENLIVGGWWYTQDVPQELADDLSKVSETIPRMNRLYLEKASNSIDFPNYVEDYFRKR
jgi:hypothetical protein